jgi:epoxide hydrolase A/B
VVRFPGMEQLIANLSTFVPQLRRTIMLPGCGHWTQQERAREVNDAMLEFLEAI